MHLCGFKRDLCADGVFASLVVMDGQEAYWASPSLHPWLHKCDYHYHYPNYHVCMKGAAESLLEAYVDLLDVSSSEPIIH